MTDRLTHELQRATPARMLGLAVTIEAGETLLIEPPHDAGGQPVCRCWSPRVERGGPAALVPIAIGAEYLPDSILAALAC